MKPCNKIILELSNYLDNELDPALRRDFEAHMSACPDCRVMIDTTRQTIEVYRGCCEPYPLPQSLHERLQKAIRQYHEKPGSETS
jgi:anti-sigma factor (TIGR02949 family)